MNRQWIVLISGIVTAVIVMQGCAKKDAAEEAALSADQPSGVIAAVEDAMKAVGEGMGGEAVVAGKSREVQAKANDNGLYSGVCDQHGYPLGLNQSDENYPGYLTYCFTTVNSGDTILGGFELSKIITCAIEKVGVTYDGVARDVVIDGNSGCFSAEQGVPAQMQATITGSSPASFNPNFEKGVILNLQSDLGLTFKIAVNVAATKASFITMEDWSDDGHIGATSGSLDLVSGDLRYESRLERIDCATEGSCGWNRHSRVHATLSMQNQIPTGLHDISFAYSNIQSPPGQNGYGGVLVTASGDLVSGIKARLWSATNGSGGAPAGRTDFEVVGNWVEQANSACYTSVVSDAGTCGAGVDSFSSNVDFLLNGAHTGVAAWFGAATVSTFTSVDVDQDVQ